MVLKDYYKILDLQTNRITNEELKVAYRLAVKKNHPDVNIKDTLAEEKIKDINEAYKVLSSPSGKRKYDRTWNLYNKKQETRQYNVKDENESILNIFLGNIKKDINKKFKKSPNQIKGDNIETKIDISIGEALHRIRKKT